jgi:hypothetical protein
MILFSVNLPTKINKNPETAKCFGIFLVKYGIGLMTTLNFVRARSRSEELEQVQFFSHLITTWRPFLM